MRLIYIDCEDCKGTGELLGKECKHCKGKGQIAIKVSDEKYLSITDYKKCRENAEIFSYISFLKHVNWETFTHKELQRVFNLVGSIVASKGKPQ